MGVARQEGGMPQRFLVHDTAVDGPATHALVIGVGRYPHLVGGGSGSLLAKHDGMGQLTSPPISARRFASWLTKTFKHPKKVGSVALLLSEETPAPFVHPDDESEKTVSRADAANVNDAVLEWFQRGDSHPDNLLIFYFCGHGVTAGTDTALLLSDYGSNPLDPLAGAIDFRRFRLGMGRCQASEQCFFVDACRTQSETLVEADTAGRYIVMPRPRNPAWAPRKAPVFYATMNGFKAYSFPNEPSIYTDALLQALDDLAADDETGTWRVCTNRIQSAVDHLIGRRALDVASLVPPTSDDASSIDLHYLKDPPKVPVYIKSEPSDALEAAALSYQPAGGAAIPAPAAERRGAEWTLRLPAGAYEFTATFPPGRTAKVNNFVRPVYRTITLTVP
jgi:hypothetical protein